MKPQSPAQTLFWSGLLPVLVFAVVEETLGLVWGVCCSILFGIAEVLWERHRQKKVAPLTWISNSLVVGLGLVSLATQEGIWFKLQPALLEGAFALLLIGSWTLRKPALAFFLAQQPQFQALAPKQRQFLGARLSGMTFRVGLFFAAHAGLAAWAALHWSTRAWAFLKGIGFTLSFLLYMVVEMLGLRRHIAVKR